MRRAFFVTGTDTGVGKTLVSAALLLAFARRGHSTIGMKPIAAGAEATPSGKRFHDVEILIRASTIKAPANLINPFGFDLPIAPHIAAQREGTTIDIEAIRSALFALQGMASVIIVEGAGGFQVPLGPAQDSADLAQRLALPMVLVVGVRLGCLNHALLTSAAIQAKGLQLAGWIANVVDAEMIATDENIDALKQRIDAPLCGRIPFIKDARPEAIVDFLDIARFM